jgi:hypothetical protein
MKNSYFQRYSIIAEIAQRNYLNSVMSVTLHLQPIYISILILNSQAAFPVQQGKFLTFVDKLTVFRLKNLNL